MKAAGSLGPPPAECVTVEDLETGVTIIRVRELVMPTDRRPRQPLVDAWEWQVGAAGRGMGVEIFFHPYDDESRTARERRIEHAKTICQDCPVLDQCRDHALATREPYGIWGGLSESERARSLGVRTLRHPGPRDRSDRPRAVNQSREGARLRVPPPVFSSGPILDTVASNQGPVRGRR